MSYKTVDDDDTEDQDCVCCGCGKPVEEHVRVCSYLNKTDEFLDVLELNENVELVAKDEAGDDDPVTRIIYYYHPACLECYS